MKNVYPQNVEENKKRDEQERLKEKRALKRQQKIDAVTKTSFFKRLNVILDSKAFSFFLYQIKRFAEISRTSVYE